MFRMKNILILVQYLDFFISKNVFEHKFHRYSTDTVHVQYRHSTDTVQIQYRYSTETVQRQYRFVPISDFVLGEFFRLRKIRIFGQVQNIFHSMEGSDHVSVV